MAERTKILYIITSTNVGGTERSLHELIRRIDRNEYSVYVCSLKKPGVFAKRISDEADGFYSLGLPEAGGVRAVLNFVPALIRLTGLIRRLRPQIIHSFLFRANILGRIAGRTERVPVIISSIRAIESDKRYKHLIDRFTSRLVHKYMAVSEAARKFTIKHVKISPDRIVTAYNGIDCDRTVLKEAYNFKISKSFKNIALIGRFDKEKGHSILIKALKTVLPQEPDIRVYFFGEGPDEGRIKRMTEKENLSEHIIFMGVAEDITVCISQMDIIVLPSLSEGLPNVLLEAMAEARPVVASRVGGVDEVVVDGETGILFEPGDVQSLAEAILKLIRNRQLAEDMGRAGRVRVLEKFSIKKTVKDTVRIYRNLLSEHIEKTVN
jgi:glycosyltransferase involved in cell wall biosynthesis